MSSPFPASGGKSLLAISCSLAATLALALLAPVVYLALDLLATGGRVSVDSNSLAWLGENFPPEVVQRVAANPNEGHGALGAALRHGGSWRAAPFVKLAEWLPFTRNNTSYFVALSIAAAALLALRGVFLNLAAHFASRAAIAAAFKLRRDIYQHCFRLGPLAVLPDEQKAAGELITDRVEELQDGWMTGRTTGIRTLALLPIALLILLIPNAWLGLAILFLAGVVWLIAGQFAAWFRRDGRQAARRVAHHRGILRESLEVLLMVKCFLMERFNQNRIERQLHDLAQSGTRQHRGEALSKPVLYTAGAITAVAVSFLGGTLILANDLSLAGLVIQLAAATAGTVAMLRYFTSAGAMRSGRRAGEEIEEFLDRRADSAQAIDAEFLKPLVKKLDWIEVSYREPGTGKMVLETISFSIPVGTKTAIVTSDASEARAVAYLLTRFLEPTAGEIRFDGKNTRWVTFESLRMQVAMVLPDHTTFTDTVANNIGCGDSFSRPQIVEAAKLAHVHGFVQQMPYGYETILGNASYSLRPGERFRIALARAILRDPAVLIVEEPSEPFDPDSTALIDDTIARIAANRTVIFLARRTTTVKRADQVIAIEDGKLRGDGATVASGSHLFRSIPSRRSGADAAEAT